MGPRIVRPPVDICRGTSPSQAPKSLPLENASPLPIAATVAVEMIGPNAWYGHEALGSVILFGQRFDLIRHGLDAPIEMAPVRAESFDHVDHAGRQLLRHGEDNGQLGAERS